MLAVGVMVFPMCRGGRFGVKLDRSCKWGREGADRLGRPRAWLVGPRARLGSKAN